MKAILTVKKSGAIKQVGEMKIIDSDMNPIQLEGDFLIRFNLNSSNPSMTVDLLQGLTPTDMIYEKTLNKSRYEILTDWIVKDLAELKAAGEEHGLENISDIELPIFKKQ